MSGVLKNAYETFECNYTCGLPLRKFLRIITIVGMVSCIVYTAVGSYIIVHIVQTEKVEWFPNSYYSLSSGPTASRIVVPPPLPNTIEDFEVHQQHIPQAPFQQNAIFPVADEDGDASRFENRDKQTRTIYYRKNVGLFICLAATLILINLIQLVSDIWLFHSTLKSKRSTSFWVFYLLDIILWIMTLICFITIFSGGGIYLLLVFILGTAIRAYIVYILHELMSSLRKPTAWSGNTANEVQPEPRSMADAEEGKAGDTSDGGEADAAPDADVESSSKSLEPTQDEDEVIARRADITEMEADNLQEQTEASTQTCDTEIGEIEDLEKGGGDEVLDDESNLTGDDLGAEPDDSVDESKENGVDEMDGNLSCNEEELIKQLSENQEPDDDVEENEQDDENNIQNDELEDNKDENGDDTIDDIKEQKDTISDTELITANPENESEVNVDNESLEAETIHEENGDDENALEAPPTTSEAEEAQENGEDEPNADAEAETIDSNGDKEEAEISETELDKADNPEEGNAGENVDEENDDGVGGNLDDSETKVESSEGKADESSEGKADESSEGKADESSEGMSVEQTEDNDPTNIDTEEPLVPAPTENKKKRKKSKRKRKAKLV